MRIAAIITFGLFLAASGCIAPHERGEPLYPVKGERPSRAEVAQLGGYVRMVDDQRVDEGKTFEVLPGCHVIGTPERWGRVDSSSGGIMVDTGRRTFALVMKPGHRYHIDVSVKMMGGLTGSAVIEATEEDSKGKKTEVFGAATSSVDIEQCKEAGLHLAP